MNMSSPSKLRLPHVSAGPFWCQPPAPRNEWHEIEALLAAPRAREEFNPRPDTRRLTFVAAALMIGGGVFAWTLSGSRNDCGADCHVVTAVAAPMGEAAPRPVATAGLAPRSDATMVEGRSVAEPTNGPTSDAAPEPIAPLTKHRRHHHHHHTVDF